LLIYTHENNSEAGCQADTRQEDYAAELNGDINP